MIETSDCIVNEEKQNRMLKKLKVSTYCEFIFILPALPLAVASLSFTGC
jgi:hypothetical protein